uniref:Uncharacterized protein n=1 Tax=Pararge aegeria TaxID=116150 RepID=S4PC89_9NEOP
MPRNSTFKNLSLQERMFISKEHVPSDHGSNGAIDRSYGSAYFSEKYLLLNPPQYILKTWHIRDTSTYQYRVIGFIVMGSACNLILPQYRCARYPYFGRYSLDDEGHRHQDLSEARKG